MNPNYENVDSFEGDILGSVFQIFVPNKWSLCNKVLIHCHGYRPVGIKLVALFDDRPMYRKLLSMGWIISALSYRREGYILEDAVDDVNKLRQYIIDRFFSGKKDDEEEEEGEVTTSSKKVGFLLDSQSMGGVVSTMISERFPDLYLGAFSISAALWIDKKKEDVQFTYKPGFKMMYLMHNNELGIINTYTQKIVDKEDQNLVKLWYVSRQGHSFHTEQEIEKSFWSFFKWASIEEEMSDEDNIPNNHDVTQYEDHPSTTVVYDEEKGGSFAIITSLPIHGTIKIDFGELDFKKLHIFRGNRFNLEFCPSSSSPEEEKRIYEFIVGDFPFVGLKEGELVAVVGGPGTKAILKRHAVRTVKNTIVEEMGPLKVGDKVFIYEKKIEFPKKKSSKMKDLLKMFQ